LYFNSVGRNSKLLLNVPPTRVGLLHDVDVARLAGFHERLQTATLTGNSADARASFTPTGYRTAEAVVDLGHTVSASMVRLAENIANGQSVARYTLYSATTGDWRILSRGGTIGYAKVDRFAPTSMRRLRLVIEDAVAPLDPVTLLV
ncbi:MAG: alpha-L-fucosidase, partial [Gemmatimonadota bacterium]|nr:alpha-L-fucosidase [Gemmatimonadota bacterium]